jgi:DNA-binding beta-propeller fold protein YncE
MLCRPKGVALDPQGNLYIADSSNSRIRVLNGAGIIQTLAGTGNHLYNGDGLPALKRQISNRTP